MPTSDAAELQNKVKCDYFHALTVTDRHTLAVTEVTRGSGPQFLSPSVQSAFPGNALLMVCRILRFNATVFIAFEAFLSTC